MDIIKRISDLEVRMEELERKGREETEEFELSFEEWSDLYTSLRLKEAKVLGFNNIQELISFESKEEAKKKRAFLKTLGPTIPNLTEGTKKKFMRKFNEILSRENDWVWGRDATLEVVGATPEFIEIAERHNRNDLGIHVWNHIEENFVSTGKISRAKVGSKVYYKLNR